MPTPAQRMQGWIDSLSAAWKERLKEWASGVIGFGIEIILDILARKGSEQLKPIIARLEATGKVPEELKVLLEQAKTPTGEFAALSLTAMAGRVAGGSVGRIVDVLLADVGYEISAQTKRIRLEPDTLILLHQKGMISYDAFIAGMAYHGYTEERAQDFIRLHTIHLPSDLVLPLWMRDKERYAPLPQNLLKLGLSQEQIDQLKELQYRMPGVQDVVTWLAREVFEPDMIAKYGLDDEWAGLDKSLFDKVGMHEDMALNYWRAHWTHPSWSQITEMLHRRLITEEDVWDWFRLVEIPPYWRGNLIKTAYLPYSRVDVRRMWDLGVLGDDDLYDAYRDLGYDDKHAKNMTTWSKLYAMTPQIIARYKNGYINAAQVKAALVALGLTTEKAQWVFETKVKGEAPERIADTKTVTVAEIIKAVKQQQVIQEDGVKLIMELGYEDWEARFKLGVALFSEPEIIPEERTVQIDTIRRRRRARYITRDEEITGLLGLNLTTQLATAYADNDDLRLVKAYEGGAE
ncbi:MAG: hypothetical protein V1849_01085 [Chloroflexota bacterium]